MRKEKLSKTELKILRLFPLPQTTVSIISEKIKIDLSWASKCISNLEDLGLLVSKKQGREKYVSVPDTPLGSALSNLMMEEPAMSLDALIGGPSLQILPLLLSPGYSTKSIADRTGLSLRTIQYRIKRWRGMGVAIYESNKYTISQRHPLVIEFIDEYTRHRNLAHQKEQHPDATIVWQYRDEYIISLDREIIDDCYKKAGATKIGYLRYDIVSKNYYYYYSPVAVEISEAEALVQTVKLDMINPRPVRYIKEAVKNNRVRKGDLRMLAKKYGVEKRVEEAL